MLVKDIMNPNVRCCRVNATGEEAALMMKETDCGALPVTSNDGLLLGMITDRDLLLAAAHERAALQNITVDRAMSPGPFTCQPDDPIRSVESTMCRHQVRRVPVVDAAGRALGIVSLSDLARAQSAQATHDSSPDRQVVAATLEAIVQPSSTSRVLGKPRETR